MAGSFADLMVPVYHNPWDDFVSGNARELWMVGGRCSIKSTIASYMVSAGVLAHPGVNAMVLRKNQVDLRGSVFNQCLFALEKLDKLRPGLRIRERIKVRTNPMMITFDNDRSIIFHGLDDPSKRKSEKPPHGYFGYIWMEEFDQFGEDEVSSLRKSVLRGGPIGQSIYTFNPPMSKAAWVNAEADRAKLGRYVYRTSYLDVLPYHPEWLGETFIEDAEDMRRSNPRRYEHELLGIATGTGGEIFTNVVCEEFDPDELRASGEVEEAWGQDFGFTQHPSTTMGCLYNPKRKVLYVFDELVHYGPNLDEIISWCLGRGLGSKDINADRAGDLAISEMKRKGLPRTRPCWKSPDGWREEGLRWMQTRERIVFHKRRCPFSFNEFKTYEVDRYANGDVKDGYPKHDDDTVDGVRYACEVWIKREQIRKVTPMPRGFARVH